MIRSSYPDVRLNKEACTLIKNGYDITLLVWYRDRSNNLYPQTKITNIIKFNMEVQSGTLMVAFYLPLWWMFIAYQLLVNEWDYIHAVDFDTYVPALIVAKIKRKPIVYDIYDFYSDMIIFPIPNFIRMAIAITDRLLIKYASAVIIADTSRTDQIGDGNNRIVIINNCPEPIDQKKLNMVYKTNDKFKIFFGGGIAEDRCIDNIILAVKDLSNVELSIVGPCFSKFLETKLKKIAENVSNVNLVFEKVHHNIIIEETFASDLIFALYNPNIAPNNQYASPNKMFEAMMCGKPIMATKGTNMENIINEEHCGVAVECDDIDQIRKAITRLVNDPEYCKLLGGNAKRAYLNKYNWAIMESRLVNLYKRI